MRESGEIMNEMVQEQAERLADQVAASKGTSLTTVVGGEGYGKTTLLCHMRERLEQKGFVPVLVSPAREAMDTGPAAMVQIGAALEQAGMIDGQFARLKDARARWSDKMAILSRWIESKHDSVVLLCDEPDRWPISADAEARHASYNNGHTMEIGRWATREAPCRRVATTTWSDNPARPDVHIVPQMDLPLSDLDLGPLRPLVQELEKRLGARLSRINFLEMKLLVAFAAVTSVDRSAQFQADWPGAKRIAGAVANALQAAPEWCSVVRLAEKIALVRNPFVGTLLEQMGIGDLAEHQRNVLLYGILQPWNEAFALHPLIGGVLTARSDLTDQERLAAHRAIMAYFRESLLEGNGARCHAAERELEGYYHAASCGERDSGFEAFFPDQYHTMGRVLSKEYKDYAAAAEVFGMAIQLDDQDDYAHHYLAYNLDCAAGDRKRIRKEYLRAIELNAKHPWWWSRWVNFLITTGRLPEAKREWSRAMDALGSGGGRTADFVYEALHLWVARLLLHRAQLDFAEEVIEDVPNDLREKHTGFRALDRLLKAMGIAARGRGVFPVHIDPKDYWSSHPHLEFPEDYEGLSMHSWNPARVEDVDDQSVRLIVGKHDSYSDTTTYGRIELPVDRFDEASKDEKADQLVSGRLLELAFYGQEGVLLIRVHPDTTYTDPDLPILDPPDSKRYLKPEPVFQ